MVLNSWPEKMVDSTESTSQNQISRDSQNVALRLVRWVPGDKSDETRLVKDRK